MANVGVLSVTRARKGAVFATNDISKWRNLRSRRGSHQLSPELTPTGDGLCVARVLSTAGIHRAVRRATTGAATPIVRLDSVSDRGPRQALGPAVRHLPHGGPSGEPYSFLSLDGLTERRLRVFACTVLADDDPTYWGIAQLPRELPIQFLGVGLGATLILGQNALLWAALPCSSRRREGAAPG